MKKNSNNPKNEHLISRYQIGLPCRFEATTPQLVTESLHDSIRHGVTFTPIGEKFRQLVKERHGLDIGPSYVIAQKAVRCEKPKWAKIFTARIYYFLVVEIYIRGITYLDAEKITPEMELQLGQALLDVLPNGTNDVVYAPNSSDVGTLIYKLACKRDPVYISFAYCNEFDGLAQMHYIGNMLSHANVFPSVTKIRGRVYSAWNEDVGAEGFYVILPEDRSTPSDDEKQRVRDDLLTYLHSIDKCGVVRDEYVSVVFTTWSSLSPEKQFALARGG